MTESAVLVDRLTTHRTLTGVPRQELEWLVAHGTLQRFSPGELVLRKGEPVHDMAIILSGHVSVAVERGTGRRHLLDSRGGDVTALLPFSRLATTFNDVVVIEPTEVLFINRSHFPEMIRECPAVIEIIVHVMVDRSRHLSATSWQDEKMLSLGRLAAGLAHELNNPASAAQRSAQLLDEAVTELSDSARALGAAGLTEAQRHDVEALRSRSLMPPTTGVFSALERGDREDDIARWLEQHHADPAPAAALAESGVTTDTLDDLVGDMTPATLDTILHWLAAEFIARSLTIDVRRASTRIHDLVSSVKRFTFMDRTALAHVDVVQGLTDTVAMLAARAKAKSVAIRLDATPGLPPLKAFPAELNQVWSNLIENAIDAVSAKGEIEIQAVRERDNVVVRVIDNGPGISPDVEMRMFDPFFTTKPVGQGSGLGLDIVLRIVRAHGGEVVAESVPGRTEFRVRLPLEAPAPPASSVNLTSPA